jgi:hypothetical protein
VTLAHLMSSRASSTGSIEAVIGSD